MIYCNLIIKNFIVEHVYIGMLDNRVFFIIAASSPRRSHTYGIFSAKKTSLIKSSHTYSFVFFFDLV